MWKNESTKFENAPTGTHLARCIKIIDIGTHTNEFQGQVTSARKNIIFWELPHELRDDGKPFIVSKFYTAFLHEKANLRKDLVSWRGRDFTPEEEKGFDPRNILGKPCQVTIIATESGKTKVNTVSGAPKGVTVPDAQNPLVFFDLAEFDREIYDSLSDGIKKLIKESAEYDSLGLDDAPEFSGEPETVGVGVSAHGSTFGEHFKPSPKDDDIPFALIFAFVGMSFVLGLIGQNIIV